MDEERMRPGHWLGSVFYVSFSASTLMVGWQEAHPAHNETHFVNPQKFSSGRDGGRQPKGQPADPALPGKTAINWKW